MALKRWTRIDKRWNKNLPARLSLVKDEIFCASSELLSQLFILSAILRSGLVQHGIRLNKGTPYYSLQNNSIKYLRQLEDQPCLMLVKPEKHSISNR